MASDQWLVASNSSKEWEGWKNGRGEGGGREEGWKRGNREGEMAGYVIVSEGGEEGWKLEKMEGWKKGNTEEWERREWRKGGDCLNHRLRGFHRLESLISGGR